MLKRGYRVGPFSMPVAGARSQGVNRSLQDMLMQLIEYRRLSNVRGWWNTVAGKAYADAKARLQEGQIRAVMSPQPYNPGNEPLYVGIDMGQFCHLVIGNHNIVFHWERIHVNDLGMRIVELSKQYPGIVAGALDRHPYTPTAEAIRDLTQCVVMPVEYRGTVPVAPVKDKTDFVTHYQGARTPMIDAVAEGVRKHRISFAGVGDEEAHIVAHLQDMVREEGEPGKPAEWVKLTGRDHYFHALAFYEFAKKLDYVKQYDPNAEQRFNFGFGTVPILGINPAPLSVKTYRKDKKGQTLSLLQPTG
jgi:hypothetical protein